MKKNIFLFIKIMFAIIFLSGCINEDFNPQEWAVTPELTFSNSGIIFNSSKDEFKQYTKEIRKRDSKVYK